MGAEIQDEGVNGFTVLVDGKVVGYAGTRECAENLIENLTMRDNDDSN